MLVGGFRAVRSKQLLCAGYSGIPLPPHSSRLWDLCQCALQAAAEQCFAQCAKGPGWHGGALFFDEFLLLGDLALELVPPVVSLLRPRAQQGAMCCTPDMQEGDAVEEVMDDGSSMCSSESEIDLQVVLHPCLCCVFGHNGNRDETWKIQIYKGASNWQLLPLEISGQKPERDRKYPDRRQQCTESTVICCLIHHIADVYKTSMAISEFFQNWGRYVFDSLENENGVLADFHNMGEIASSSRKFW